MPIPWKDVTRSRWFMPLFSLALAAAIFAAFAIGGDPWTGVRSALVMVAFGAIFVFGMRSETIAGLGGPGRDERWELIDMRAGTFAAATTIIVLIGAWLLEVAQGGDGDPYALLLAVAGVSYIVAIIALRRRM